MTMIKPPVARFNYAMLLTWIRVVLTPVFACVFFSHHPVARWGVLLIAVLIELTDLFDGIIARRYDLVTDLGKTLDPFADSISRFTMFVCIAAELMVVWGNAIPILIVLCIFYRDAVVATVRTVCGFRGVVVPARVSGKVKAIVQACAILPSLVMRVFPGPPDSASLTLTVSVVLLGVAGAITVWSGVDYVVGNWAHLKPLFIAQQNHPDTGY